MASLFADTSALIKWYIAEARSEDVEALFVAQSSVAISRLAGVELCSALGRRRRSRQITSRLEKTILNLFSAHRRNGNLVVLPLTDNDCAEAEHLMHTFPAIPLRTLDALQLAAAKRMRASEFASADRIQIAAAKAMGLRVHDFS